MKYLLTIPLFLFYHSFLLAQNSEIDKLNEKIKNYIFKKPDSAKAYLFQLLEHDNQLADTTLAEAYSKLGITYNQLAVYDSSEYYFKKGIKITSKYPETQADIYSNLAINYRTTAEYSKSLEALEQAMELYKETGNLIGEGVVYGEIASNYSYMLQQEKAITYLKKSIEIFKETNDPRVYIIQQKLANAYFNNKNYEFALDLYEQAIPEFAKQNKTGYYLTLPAYAETLIQLDRAKEGEERLKEAYAGLKEANNKEYMYMVLGKLGYLYSETNRPQQAEEALSTAYAQLRDMRSTRFLEVASRYLNFLNDKGDLTRAMQVIQEVETTTDNFQFKLNGKEELDFLIGAQKTYRKKKLYEESLRTFDRIDFLKDSIKNATDQIKVKELEESYQNQIQRQKNLALTNNNLLLKENSAKQNNIIYLELAILVLLIIVILIIYRSHKKKIAFEKASVSNLRETNALLNEKQELRQELLKEKENSLIIKEQELVSMSMEIAEIQGQIKDLIDSSNEDEISPGFSQKIIGILDGKNYWQYFKTKFTEVYPDFEHSLAEMYPDLSENELAFCSMLKLQLSTKEISSLMGISQEMVVAKKNEIRKKMSLQEDLESFEQLMQEL